MEKKYLVTCPKGQTCACEKHKDSIVEINNLLGTTVKVEDAKEDEACASCGGQKNGE